MFWVQIFEIIINKYKGCAPIFIRNQNTPLSLIQLGLLSKRMSPLKPIKYYFFPILKLFIIDSKLRCTFLFLPSWHTHLEISSQTTATPTICEIYVFIVILVVFGRATSVYILPHSFTFTNISLQHKYTHTYIQRSFPKPFLPQLQLRLSFPCHLL